ncbi:ABC transporter permease subunit [Nakamurella sp. YIM 132087]|uniref:ABC transporter permease subunit n=1 Tax=Nakamurella alba TaxID=2665158 RepID=A0A7K1FQC9_9ACTN|nr:ABC transporter permease subunit [Nakamurella alba]
MSRYIAGRVLQLVPLLIAVVVISFAIVHLAPGDPATVLAGPTATNEYIEEVRVRYGLDQSTLQQFLDYVGQLVRLDLGQSFSTNQPVLEVLLSRLPATLLLIVASELLGLVLGMVLGTMAAQRWGSPADRLISGGSLALASMPVFWLGMLLILLFSVQWQLLPSSGMSDPFVEPGTWAAFEDLLKHLLLPVVTLTAAWTLPTYLRITRAGVLQSAREDFVRTARAKGASETRVYFAHALRTARLPVITLAGLNFGLAVTGAVLTETLFGWPGVGQTLNQAILSRDYPLMMGIFLLAGVGVAVANLVTDVVNAFLDPRVSIR